MDGWRDRLMKEWIREKGEKMREEQITDMEGDEKRKGGKGVEEDGRKERRR